MNSTKTNDQNDFQQILFLIEKARNQAFIKVNEELILLYFRVGEIVSGKVEQGAWGEKTVGELAKFIEHKLPGFKGFNRRGLYRMKQFYETYSTSSECYRLWIRSQSNTAENYPSQNVDNQIFKFVSTVLTQIPWSSHLHILSKTNSASEKLFYLITAASEKLSVRELERQIDSASFERTFLAREKANTLPTPIPQNLFKDPYIFEFLNLPENYSETDLERALVLNLQHFILEIGKGFTYLGNQHRIQVGNKDYYTDLLFYHRDLQCLVLFELKIREFEPEFLGKLNFYLEALERNVKRKHENQSIGILLCKGKDNEVVEYAMARNTSPAVIADYETQLIDKKVLADKLHQWTEQLSGLKNDI